MKQEYIDLLRKDIAARLPYEPVVVNERYDGGFGHRLHLGDLMIMIRRRMFTSYLAVALLLAIGLCFGPIYMIMCDAYTVKLRGSQYGYLQYYDEFTEVWNTVYAYEKWDLNGEYYEHPLHCESKEELEKYRKKFKTVNDVKSFMENEKKKYDAYKESKYIY